MSEPRQSKKKETLCPFCQQYHKGEARFCPKTGKAIPPLPGAAPDSQPQNTIVIRNMPASRIPPQEETLVCPHCAMPHKKKAKFCPGTGRALNLLICPSCRQESFIKSAPIRFCPKCGKAVPNCPYPGCEGYLEKDASFCSSCFSKVKSCPNCFLPHTLSSSSCRVCARSLSDPGGAWLMFKGNPERTGSSEKKLKFPLKLKWSFPDPGKGTKITASPLIFQGNLYLASCDGNLYCLNQYSGKHRWSRPMDGPLVSTPVIQEGVIFAASVGGKIYAVDCEKGRLIWVVPKSTGEFLGKVEAALAAFANKVFVATLGGRIYCLDASTGDVLWLFPQKEKPLAPVSSSPAISRGLLIFGTHDGLVYALDISTGKVRWRFPRASPLAVAVLSSPAVWGGLVYFGDRSGRMFALDIATGEDTWHFTVSLEGGIHGSPSVGAGGVFVGTWAGYLYCLAIYAGGVKWRVMNEKIDVLDAICSTPLILADNTVLVGSESGFFYARDIDGNDVWKHRLESEIRSSGVVSDGFLYVGTNQGYLYAFFPCNV